MLEYILISSAVLFVFVGFCFRFYGVANILAKTILFIQAWIIAYYITVNQIF